MAPFGLPVLALTLSAGVSEGQYITISTWCLGAALPHTFWTIEVLGFGGAVSQPGATEPML